MYQLINDNCLNYMKSKEFQEGDSIHPLRKCLVGDSDNLYSIKQETTIEQLSLF